MIVNAILVSVIDYIICHGTLATIGCGLDILFTLQDQPFGQVWQPLPTGGGNVDSRLAVGPYCWTFFSIKCYTDSLPVKPSLLVRIDSKVITTKGCLLMSYHVRQIMTKMGMRSRLYCALPLCMNCRPISYTIDITICVFVPFTLPHQRQTGIAIVMYRCCLSTKYSCESIRYTPEAETHSHPHCKNIPELELASGIQIPHISMDSCLYLCCALNNSCGVRHVGQTGFRNRYMPIPQGPLPDKLISLFFEWKYKSVSESRVSTIYRNPSMDQLSCLFYYIRY